MGRYFSDLRFALRQLRLNPLFTLVAALSLALGIGANTAIFQLIDAIRLRALPVTNPQELGYLDYAPHSKRSGWWSSRSSTFTSVNWDSIRTHQEGFSELVAWSAKQFNLSTEGKARYAEGLFVSGEFFRTLGARAVAGRVFTAEDDRPGCGSPTAVIGYSFWQSEFAQDPAITSRSVRLDGKLFHIIGVTAPNSSAWRSGTSSTWPSLCVPTRCSGNRRMTISRREPRGGFRSSDASSPDGPSNAPILSSNPRPRRSCATACPIPTAPTTPRNSWRTSSW